MARTVLVLICLAVAAAGCGGGNGAEGEERTDVVAAFYPLAWAAERIGGDGVRVRNLTRPGTEPHDLELSPRDVEEIRSADVVLYLGAGFQPAVEDAVDGADGEAVDLLAGQKLFAGEPHEDEDEGGHDDDGEQHEDEQDPHVWLDPTRMSAIVDEIAAAVGARAGADELKQELAALDADFRDGLADCRRRELVTSHAAFGYLARRYGLEQIAITGVSPEAEPTPRDLEEVVEHVRETKATTIFFETLISPRLAETVARETGAETAVLDPLEGIAQDDLDRGADYLSVMRENLASLRRGLGCR
ncbi:MAG TPA: metal ABC transporter substrate-binding protein [Gaiellaceae bacterium]